MDQSKKPRKRRLQVERDVAKVITAPVARVTAEALTDGELYRRSMAQQQAWLDRDLPWRASYVNWCTHVGRAAARHNAAIGFGASTYEAWELGVSPEQYASEHARDV